MEFVRALLITIMISALIGCVGADSAEKSTLDRLLALLSADRPAPLCSRRLSFGGSCECNFRDTGPDMNLTNVEFDKHVYGRRRVCIGERFFWRDSCRVLSLQSGLISGDIDKFRTALVDFGCDEKELIFIDADREFGKYKSAGDFSLRALFKKNGLKSIDILDISAYGKERIILADLLDTRKPRISARQLTWTVVLDVDETIGELQSSFSYDLAEDTIRLIKDIESVGYKMVSYRANPKCVQHVKAKYGVCVPVFVDATWMRPVQ